MESYTVLNQRAYDKLSSEYDGRARASLVHNQRISRPFVEYLKNHFDYARVLELGCGNGLNLGIFENEGFETYAIDISNKMIRVARRRAPNTNFVSGDFLEYDFGDLHFQGMFASAFIHLFSKEDAVKVLGKARNLLIPGGILYLSTTLHQVSEEGYFEKSDYNTRTRRFRKKWRLDELKEVLDSLNFQVIRSENYAERERRKLWINLSLVPDVTDTLPGNEFPDGLDGYLGIMDLFQT